MGDNNLFCVIFQKNGNGLKAIYHGQISGEGVSSVIGRSGSDMGSVGASGNSLPNFNPEHFKNATFTDTGDITIDNKTFKNPFQNFDSSKFDSSKLKSIDQAQFQGLIKDLTSAKTDEDIAKIGIKLATAIGKEHPDAKQYVELVTKFAGTEGAANAVGTFAKAAQPFVKFAVGMALDNAKDLNDETKAGLRGLADNVLNVIADNAGDAASFLAEVVKELEAAGSTTDVTSDAKNENTTREEDKPTREMEVNNPDNAMNTGKKHEQQISVFGFGNSNEKSPEISAASLKSVFGFGNSNEESSKPPAEGESKGGRRTKRKSKHHRRRKNKSKNKKR